MKTYLVRFAIAVSLLLAGCNHCCRNRCNNAQQPLAAGPQALQPGYLPPHPLTPMQSGPVQAPPPPAPMTAAPTQPYPPPAPPPSSISGYNAVTPADTRWQPAPGPGVRLSPPEGAAITPRDGLRLQQPVVTETPSAPSTSSPTLPVGIPQFAIAREGVTSGLKPLAEGFDWLKASGYRTVLHLRAPGEDDSAERTLAESRGLTFLSLAVSPETLPQATAEFDRTVSHKPNHPLFVYDSDGVRAGGLWYLYYRTVDGLADDAARRKAASLGLREDAQGEAAAMWLAIQQQLRATK